MFNEYLNDKDRYLELERSFYDHFRLKVQENPVGTEVFKAPYYNTFFSNGSPFMDGNPIFSVKNQLNGQILRVVLDEDAHELCSYRDKEAGCELVVIGNLALLEEIKEKVSAWICAQ
ncbi:hypothetical protein [Pseudomonas sp. PH1b]|uniref:hypothetical protein n=1 Tax=Pseudomonas sp. PH1b TaxID=1397282 RepID=UPI0004A7AA46|nr:hypothetical protein [Pseudomonas sp. PH1b]